MVFPATAALVHLCAITVRGFVPPTPPVVDGEVCVRSSTGSWRSSGRGTRRREGLQTTRLRASSEGEHAERPALVREGVEVLLLPSSSTERVENDRLDGNTPATTGTRRSRSCRSRESAAATRQEFLQIGGVLACVAGVASGVAVGGRSSGVRAADVTAAGVEQSATALQKQVLSYIREALPGWRSLPDTEIELKQITGGITNVIFKARNAATGQGALVRVYGKDTDLLLDRRKEAAVFSELSTLGFGPRKLGEFKGGRVEELLDARAATPEELLQTSPFDVPRAIAAQLASLHGQQVRSSAGSRNRPVMWTSIDRWLKTASRLDSAKKFPLDKVAEEVAWLKRNLPGPASENGAAVSPDGILAAEIANGIVFAHNDLLSGNVLVGPRGTKQISTLRLIDFEYSDYNPCGYDIANHFCECAGFDADFRRRYPSEKQRKDFLRAYVEAARPEALHKALSADDLISELARHVDRFALASHLTWALWAVIQANTSEIEGFDFAGYAAKRLDGYAFHKGEFYSA